MTQALARLVDIGLTVTHKSGRLKIAGLNKLTRPQAEEAIHLAQTHKDEILTALASPQTHKQVDPWPPEIGAMISWLRSADLPESFGLHYAAGASVPYVKVTCGERFKADLLAELAQGPKGPRARYGAVQGDLETVYRLFGPGRTKH